MFRMSLAAVLVASVSAGGLTAAEARTGDGPVLVAHRAVYDLELKEASDRSGIEGMYGRMVYEFTGSQCEGYTTNFRFVTQIDTGEDLRTTDQQTTTFEDVASGKFRFETKSFTDEQLDKEVSGSATEKDGGVSVELTAPERRELELASSDFPTEHMREVIRNAKMGKQFFEARVFDGSDNGDQSLITSTIVGRSQKPSGDDSDASKAGAFSDSAFWPVTIAYFNDTSSSDAMPIYRMSFKLYENGITRDLTLDYGDFVLSGKLTKLDMLETASCG